MEDSRVISDIRFFIINSLNRQYDSLAKLLQMRDEDIQSRPNNAKFEAIGNWNEILAVCSDSIEEKEKHYELAFESYQKGKEVDGFCSLRLGQMYESGNYVPKDVDKAIEIYREQLEAQDDLPDYVQMQTKAHALFCLGRCYLYERNNVMNATNFFGKCREVCLDSIAHLKNSQLEKEIIEGYTEVYTNMILDVDFHLKLCKGEHGDIIEFIHNYALVGNFFMDDTCYFSESRNRYNMLISTAFDYVRYNTPYKTDSKWREIFTRFLYYYLYIYIDQKKYEKALELFRNFYDSKPELKPTGEMASTVGYCYFMLAQQSDQDYEENMNKAVQWYTEAAKQKDLTALTTLGMCYLYGWGVDKNLEEAKAFFSDVIYYYSYYPVTFQALDLHNRNINETPLQNQFGNSFNIAVVLFLLCDYCAEDGELLEALGELNPSVQKICQWLLKDYTKGRADSVLFFYDWLCKNSDAVDHIIESDDFTKEFCDLLLAMGFQLNQSVTKTVVTSSSSVDFCDAEIDRATLDKAKFVMDYLQYKAPIDMEVMEYELPSMLEINDEKSKAKTFFSDKIWNSLKEETRVVLNTLDLAGNTIKAGEDSEFDYACLVVELGKALEVECRRVFFDAYTNFLYQEFTRLYPQSKNPKKKIVLSKEQGDAIFQFWPRFLLGCSRKQFEKEGYVSIKHNVTFGSIEEAFGTSSGLDDEQKALAKKQLSNYLKLVGESQYSDLPFYGFWGDQPKECQFVKRCNSVYRDIRNKGAHGQILTRKQFDKCFQTILGKLEYSPGAELSEDTGLLMEMYTRVNINEVMKLLYE